MIQSGSRNLSNSPSNLKALRSLSLISTVGLDRFLVTTYADLGNPKNFRQFDLIQPSS